MRNYILVLLMTVGGLTLSQSVLAGSDRVYIKGSSCVVIGPFSANRAPVIYDNWGIRANEAPTGISNNIYNISANVMCPVSLTAPVGRTYNKVNLYMDGYERNSATPGDNNLSCTLQATDDTGNNYQEAVARFSVVQTEPTTASASLTLPGNIAMYFSVMCHLPGVPDQYTWSSHLTALTLQFNY